MYYPPPHHFYRGGMCRSSGPSRLIWFFLGAGATFWWLKHREAKGQVPSPCARHRLQPPTSDNNQQNPGWPQNMSNIPRAINNIPAGNAPIDPSSQSPSWGTPTNWKWDPDREHLEKISKQAVDAMADLTETTLESVLSTTELLKAKLAEHRAQRERQQKAIEQQLEAERKNPPRPSLVFV